MVTVDLPVLGYRERDRRNGFVQPGPWDRAFSVRDGPAPITELEPGTLTWRDIAPIRSWAPGLPLVLKGILHAEDARLAVEHGADAIVVSNHGARQLDRVAASVDVLEEVVDAVAGRCEVWVDGGVRRGLDVAIALALGARGVLLGRPVLWALAAGGEAGVARALAIVREELEIALALLGTPGAERRHPGACGSLALTGRRAVRLRRAPAEAPRSAGARGDRRPRRARDGARAGRRDRHDVQRLARRRRGRLRQGRRGHPQLRRRHRRAAGGRGQHAPDRAVGRLAVLERPAARRLALPADRPARGARPLRARADPARPGVRARQRAPHVGPVRPGRRAGRAHAAAGAAAGALDAAAGDPRRARRAAAGAARGHPDAADRRLQHALAPRLDPRGRRRRASRSATPSHGP